MSESGVRSIPLAVFCDFEGTFAVQDVGSTLVRRHVSDLRPALWKRYARAEITAWEYNLEVFGALRLAREEVDAFLRTIELDAGARGLVDWCDQNAVPFRVLSDGFDYNLDRLQALHAIHFDCVANHLEIDDAGRWKIEAGYANPECFCGTGVCKLRCIEAFRAEHPEAAIAHIGNGRVSDTCGALAADITFAKDSLAQELGLRGLPYERFETLHDVVPVLGRMLSRSSGPASGGGRGPARRP